MRRQIVVLLGGYCARRLLLGAFLFLSGCLPHGLPEYFSPGPSGGSSQNVVNKELLTRSYQNERYGRGPVVLIVSEDNLDRCRSGECDDYLGAQFLLGVIPVTGVYFQHGAEDQLVESLISRVSEQGWIPLKTLASSNETAVNALSPDIVLKPTLENETLSAYDLFFVRLLSASATVKFAVETKNRNGQYRQVRLLTNEASKQRFSFTGQAPELSNLFQDLLKTAITAELETAFSRAKWVNSGNKAPLSKVSYGQVVVILRPLIVDEKYEFLSSVLTDSYGFIRQPRYSREQLERIAQRGFEDAFSKLKLSGVSAPTISDQGGCVYANSNVWQLATSISKAEIYQDADKHERLRVEATLSIKDCTHQGGALIIKGNCAVEELREDTLDGYWVFTMERAAKRLITVFLKEDRVACNFY